MGYNSKYTGPQLDAQLDKAHEHANKAVIDAISSAGSGSVISSSERSGLHSHANKAILDAISAAGSGSIITSAERTSLSRLAGVTNTTTTTASTSLSGTSFAHNLTVDRDTEIAFSSLVTGAFYTLSVLMDGTGGHLVTFASASVEFEDGLDAHINTGANEETLFFGYAISASKIRLFRDPHALMLWAQHRTLALAENGGVKFETEAQNPYIAIPEEANKVGLNDFSVRHVLRNDSWSDGVNSHMLLRLPNLGNNRLVYVVATTGTIQLIWVDSGGVQNTYNFTNLSLPTGRVFELILTVDRDGMATAYVDGVKKDEVDVSAESDIDLGASNSDTVRIGSSGSNTFETPATLYRYQFFNLALTQSEIDEIRRDGLPWRMKGASLTDTVAPGTLNGGFESLDGADDFSNWVEVENGTSTVTDETVEMRTGSHAAKFTLDGSSSFVAVRQDNIITVGKLYQISFWAKKGSGTNAGLQWGTGASGGTYGNIGLGSLTASYAQFQSKITGLDDQTFIIGRLFGSDAGAEIYIDDLTIRRLGCVVDLDLGFGQGLFFPDLSGNNWHGNGVSGVNNLIDRTLPIENQDFSATTDVDFNESPEIILGQLTSDIVFTGSNYRRGAEKVIYLEADGTARNFTFPSGWKFHGNAAPGSIAANKTATLTLKCLGDSESDVRAYYAEEP